MGSARPAPRQAVAALDELLAADDPSLWVDGAGVWRAWLTPRERMALFVSLACSMHPEIVAQLAVAVVGGAGHPLPSYLSPGEEARLWVELANPQEARAYTLAGFLALSPKDRRDFLSTVTRITGEAA
jgi:hypothetical protein